MAMARSKSAAGAVGVGKGVVDEKLKCSFPNLHDFLTEVAWDDGKPRKTGTLMLLVEDGWWKAWVHDRDCKASAWIAGTTMDDVLLMVEDALERSTMAWRADRR